MPNGQVSVDITITVSPFFTTTGFVNVAEIAGARMRVNARDDEDGTFDNDPATTARRWMTRSTTAVATRTTLTLPR
ncbi:MAG: hypothetical protein R3B47_01765 [Bacteroidia bacterium]